METVGIWSGSDLLREHLLRRLVPQYRIIRAEAPAALADAALLIVAPDAENPPDSVLLRPRLALLPGWDAAPRRAVRAACAVSYGLGGQNTLTLSSMVGGTVSVALQRELLTLSGRTVERQEWVLPRERDMDTADRFLCLVGALLLLDCEPLESINSPRRAQFSPNSLR